MRSGHVWIYSNEVDVDETPLKGLPVGGEVVVEDYRGKPIGRAYANPHSLICARIFSRDARQSLGAGFIRARIQEALALREAIYPGGCYRLVYGESDGLPGLVIDRFEDVFVVQTGTAGMEVVQQLVADVLQELFEPKAIVARNVSSVRGLEQLSTYSRALSGVMPASVTLTENGVRFEAPLEEGQKTGWFYDHREARRRLQPLVAGQRVLDVFSYSGAWGVMAAAAGATEVTCIDSSSLALDYVHRNAQANGVADRLRTIEADAFEALRQLLADGEKFDVVVLDPPAFIKRKKDFKNGLAGYHALNELGVRLVQAGGLLVSASCSMHLGAGQLQDVVRASARHNDRFAQIVASEGQGMDHPVHPAIAETRYLKSCFARILMNH